MNQSDYDDFPDITAALLLALKGRFPPLRPTLTVSLDEVRFSAGQQAVIDFLESMHRVQMENPYGKN